MHIIKWSLALVLSLPFALTPQAATKAPTPQATAQPIQTIVIKHGAYPVRGMKMSQVKKRFGRPLSTRISKGKMKKQWPKITVWNYGKFSVYFERSTVLHTVIH